MNEHAPTVKFQLDAPDDCRERMTEELDKAPTYMVKMKPGKTSPKIISVVSPRTIKISTPGGSLSVSHLSKKLSENVTIETRKQRYQTGELLGEGGMGEVYEALDHNLKRTVAVKILKDDADVENVELFIQEGALAAEMDHPNIVPVYDLDADDRGRPFMSMKKVEGKSLESLIQSRSIPNSEEVILIFLKVCDALRYAHSRGKIHQDIKPANIMLGTFGEVFLIDWGASSQSYDQLQLSPVYMSPQQARGEIPTAIDDVYCLGASMFHVLTGRYPTNAETIDELWDMKLAGKIDPPTEREYRHAAPELLAIAMKAMAPDLDDRYATVDAFADDLKAYQMGFATSAENASAVRLLQLFLKRRWRETLVTVAILAAVVVAGILYAVNSHRAQVAQLSAALEIQTLERQKREKELEMRRLEGQRREQWLPFLAVDFTKPEALDAQLLGEDLVDISKTGLADMKVVSRLITAAGPVPSEFKVETTFVCEYQPSFSISIDTKKGKTWRVFELESSAMLIDHHHAWQLMHSGPHAVREAMRGVESHHLALWKTQSHWCAELNGKRILECYDPRAIDAGDSVALRIGRTFGSFHFMFKSFSITHRRPPEYPNVLVAGKTLLNHGQFEAARAWFDTCTRYSSPIAKEAAYLRALSNPYASSIDQYRELEAIARDTQNPYRLNALTQMIRLSLTFSDLAHTYDLMRTIKRDFPSWEPDGSIVSAIKRKASPSSQEDRQALAQRLADAATYSLDLSHMDIDRLPKLGSKLVNLNLDRSSVKTLSGVEGLRLEELNLSSTGVTDLSPLRGMKVMWLSIAQTGITDLSPLAGMRMEILNAKRMTKPVDLSTITDLSVWKPIFDGSKLLHTGHLKRLSPSMFRLSGCGLTDLHAARGATTVGRIKAIGNGLERLDGLEGMTLGLLVLSRNKLKNLEGIQNCQLTGSLSLTSNPLTDISQLKGQPLRTVWLSDTLVTDLSVIATLPNFENLHFNGDPTNASRPEPDFSTLGPCTLKSLTLRQQRMSSLKFLAKVTVTESLDVSGNPIDDLSAIAAYPIRNLQVADTNVKTLDALTKMTTLESLHAGALELTRSSPLSDLEGLPTAALKKLELGACAVKDLGPLASAHNLTELHLKGLPVKDYSPILGLPLSILEIKSLGVDSIPDLHRLKSLNFLIIEGTVPADPAGLTECPQIAGLELLELSLKNNRIKDVNWLRTARISRKLDLSGNPLTDVSPLKGQPLVKLNLGNTKVTDISVISTMPKLRDLNIQGLTLNESSRKLLDQLSPVLNIVSE